MPVTVELPTELPVACSLTALAEPLTPLVAHPTRWGQRYPLVPRRLPAVLANLAG